MECPKCGGKTDVTETRVSTEIRTAFKLPSDLKEAIKSDHVRRRRRTCLECGHRFSTYEMTSDLTQAMLGWISKLVEAQPAQFFADLLALMEKNGLAGVAEPKPCNDD